MSSSPQSNAGEVETEILGWQTFFDELGRFLDASGREFTLGSEDYANYVVERLELCIITLNLLYENLLGGITEENNLLSPYAEVIHEVLDICRTMSRKYNQKITSSSITTAAYTPQYESRMGRGHPRFVISREQLLYLFSLSFNWTDISNMLGVSRMTIYRRRVEYGLVNDPRTVPTDSQLRTVLREIKTGHPEIGEVLIMGKLRAMGYKVTRERLRQFIRSIDPLHAALRWRGGLTARRPYCVPGPNSLWHIDGNHKLIRWKFVVHGGIDGYSQMVVFLRCSGNNRASTVYNLFLDAVHVYGLPSRVRSDQGRENILVARHMIEYRGADRRSMITGSSVHNQRIERLWRDLFRCAVKLYYRLFYYLEDQGMLLPTNQQHIYALHYVFLPRINKALSVFYDGWNHHGVRTARNRSSYQLYTEGALQLQQSGHSGVDFFDSVDDMYGAEEVGLVGQDDEGVEVPSCTFSLHDNHFALLEQGINPLADSDNYGIDLYQQTLEFISATVRQNPSLYNN